MLTEPLFTIVDKPSDVIAFTFDGMSITAPTGVSVAAALLASGVNDFRTSIVGMTPRAPFCMMGVCFECLVEIDGVPARQSCLIPVREGMVVRRQEGAASLNGDEFGEPE